MRNSRKGFTLIELLAVIVILAIIALIATPLILNTISKAKKNAAVSGALGYIDAVEKQTALNLINSDTSDDITSGNYNISDLVSKKVNVKGKAPSAGCVIINEKGIVTDYSLLINNYVVNKDTTSSGAIAELGTADNLAPVCGGNGSSNSVPEHTLYDNVELGGWIEMTPTSTSYLIDSSLTGGGDETINPSLMKYWRIINKKSDGTIELLAQYVQQGPYFRGETGYKNYVGVLNTIAAQYANDKYTVSNHTAPYYREIGYDGQTEYITGTLTVENGGNIGSDNGTNYCFISNPNDFNLSEKNNGFGGDNLYFNDLLLVRNAIGKNDNYSHGLYTNYIDNNGTVQTYNYDGYYLASRYYNPDGKWGVNKWYKSCTGAKTLYDPSCDKENVTCYEGGGIATSTQSAHFYVRPIITLKPNIELPDNGDGQSKETAWVLE